MKAQAGILVGPSKIVIMEIDVPHPGPGQVLIEVAACGLCHSDLPFIEGRYGFGVDAFGVPMIVPPMYPFPTGHEPNGVVLEVGPGVTRFKPGDRVGGFVVGGMATHAIGEASMLAKIPEQFDIHTMLAEPIGAVSHITHAAGAELGDVAVVIGAGYMGLMVLSGLARFPLKELIAVDLVDERLAMAKKLGATITINAAKEDPVARIMQITGGRGANPVIELSGHLAGLKTAASVVRGSRGKILAASVYGNDELFSSELGLILMARCPQLMLTHPWWSPDYAYELGLGEWGTTKGMFNGSELVTHRFKLEEVNEGYAMLANPPKGFMKAVVIIK